MTIKDETADALRVEQVAEAILVSAAGLDSDPDQRTWNDAEDMTKDNFRRHARAALAALSDRATDHIPDPGKMVPTPDRATDPESIAERWTARISAEMGVLTAGCWRCGALSEILARILCLSGIKAEVVMGKANGVPHVWVQAGGVVYDPTAGQFTGLVSYEAPDRATDREGWKCTACLSVFTAEKPHTKGTGGDGPNCPNCKAWAQYTYPHALHRGDPCESCGVPHDEITSGPCSARQPIADMKGERWLERWYGSEPEKGSAIVTDRRDLIAYLGGDQVAHAAATAIASAHNAALATLTARLAQAEGAWRDIADWEGQPTGPSHEVLLCVSDGGLHEPIIGEAWYDPDAYGGSWWWAGGRHDDYFSSPIIEMQHGVPTYWMPMPVPPRAALADPHAGRLTARQPCDTCGEPVAVHAVSPSECFCSNECADPHAGGKGGAE